MYMMLCMFGLMAGCDDQRDKPPTLEQIQAYEQREALTIRQEGSNSRTLNVSCIDGVQYYSYYNGHESFFAPVVDKTTLLFKPCGLP